MKSDETFKNEVSVVVNNAINAVKWKREKGEPKYTSKAVLITDITNDFRSILKDYVVNGSDD